MGFFAHPLEELISKGVEKFSDHRTKLQQLLTTFLNQLLQEHMQYERSDVIVWSLYISMRYDIPIDDFSNQILGLEDPVPALISYEHSKKSERSTDKYFVKISEIDQREWWLYVYELYKEDHSRINSIVEYEKFYQFLVRNGISFLRDNKSESKETDIIDPESHPF